MSPLPAPPPSASPSPSTSSSSAPLAAQPSWVRFVRRRLARAYVADVERRRARLAARGQVSRELRGDCGRRARCCEERGIAVVGVVFFVPLVGRAFLWWRRVVNGFDFRHAARAGTSTRRRAAVATMGIDRAFVATIRGCSSRCSSPSCSTAATTASSRRTARRPSPSCVRGASRARRSSGSRGGCGSGRSLLVDDAGDVARPRRAGQRDDRPSARASRTTSTLSRACGARRR